MLFIKYSTLKSGRQSHQFRSRLIDLKSNKYSEKAKNFRGFIRNLEKIRLDEVTEKQAFRPRVAKTQQP